MRSVVTIACLVSLLATASASVAGETAAEPAGEEVCRVHTNHGDIVVRFYPNDAPRTVAHFKQLVRDGFYDGKPFYRVVAGHVIQAGDGGENDVATVKAEFNERPHVVGAVGLARSEDPDSGSTEFYICHAPRPHLDGRYTVFGQVAEGLDVLAAIGAVEVEEKWVADGEVAFHEPKQAVVIEAATIERREPRD